jgi:hypothetical protein
MSYRLANPDDDEPIIAALRKLQAYASTYGFTQQVDFHKAVSSVLSASESGDAYIVDGYLVLVDVLLPWYSDERVLQEWLVLKVYDGGSVSSIPAAVRSIAAERGCGVIITADSSPVNIVAKAYREAGFHPLTQSFYTKV